MPPDYSGKFTEPSNLTGEWSSRRQLYFWHCDHPAAVRTLVEKMTAALLTRDPADSTHLSFLGASSPGHSKHTIRLRFESVIEGRNLFSLQVESTAPRQWVAEAAFLQSAERTFEYWRARLTTPGGEIQWAAASPQLYRQRHQEYLTMEAESASRVEDPAPIDAIKQAILESLRSGKCFRTAHKEGGTILSYSGSSFLREDYGEDPSRQRIPSGEAMLTCLRNFYDWESRRDLYPHRPTELAVWQYIQNRVRD